MSDKIEKIGSVTLNYKYYDGVDHYSEGEAEDYLLSLVTKFTEKDYEHVIQNSRSWSVMYHLSHIRENVISWLPIPKTSKVLEIGAGCGAITGMLSKMSESVTCIELSKKRSLINATRHKEYSNIEIMVGNFQDIEPNLTEKYDYITLIGVLEYAKSYIQSDDPYREFLTRIASHLAPNGKIIIAIENKFGLKYFAGCKEDHTGSYFEGIEGYTNSEGVETFSKDGLEKIINSVGLNSQFYYPYPDYKLPSVIYSDDVMPGLGELNTNLRNFDNDRVVLFDEAKVFDSIIKEGNFNFFSNSFLAIATREDFLDTVKAVPIYAKYSNERIPEYRIATIIYKNRDGEKSVYKTALSHAANAHIKAMGESYEVLLNEYAGTRLKPNKCTYIPGKEPVPLVAGASPKSIDTVQLEYVSGMSYEAYLYELVKAGEFDVVTERIKRFINLVCGLSHGAIFRQTERFKQVFGDRNFDEVYTGKAGSNFDLIFGNILFDKEGGFEGEWTALDYEWIFDFPIPDKFIAFRSLYYFAEYSESGYKEHYENLGINIYEMFGFTENEVKNFIDMEHRFQVNIIGGVASLEVLHAMMPTSTVFIDNLLKEREMLKNLNNPKVYFSYGEGYSEDRRIYVTPTIEGTKVTMDIPLQSNMRGLRIDPTEYPSIVSVDDIRLVNADDSTTEIFKYVVNGYPISGRTFIYDTDDAQIIIDNITGKEKALRISYEVSMFLENMYEDVLNLAKFKANFDYRKPDYKGKILNKLHLKKNYTDLQPGYYFNVKE